MGPVRPLEGRCQPESIRRGKQPGDVLIPLRTEVVNLVENNEPEPVAELVGTQIRGIVGRHSHRLDALLAAAKPADRGLKFGFEFALPLFEQVDRRNDDQRRLLTGGHRCKGDYGFAGSGREFEHATAVAVEPRVEGILLVLAEFVARRQRDRLSPEDGIVDIGVNAAEHVADRRVVVGRRAGRLAPWVALNARQAIEGGIALAVALDTKGAVLKAERERHYRWCDG